MAPDALDEADSEAPNRVDFYSIPIFKYTNFEDFPSLTGAAMIDEKCIRYSFGYSPLDFITFKMNEKREMKCLGPVEEITYDGKYTWINGLGPLREWSCAREYWKDARAELNKAFDRSSK